MKLSSRIYQASHHTLLIDFLFARFTYLSKEQWIDRIRDRLILVNDKPAVPETDLKNGDIVSYEVGDISEPDADLSYSIVYEDDWIIGVNKPGNLLVHKAGASITRNLVFLLRHSSNNPAYEHIHSVNRLDRETSGVVLFSKHPDCLKRLHRDFASGKVEKEYFAVVHNPPAEKSIHIELPIGQDKGSSVHYKFCVDRTNGKSAATIIETISACNGYALLRARPLTGRTHQIRVHLAAIGSPVVGDKLYGMSEERYLAWRSDPSGSAGSLEFKRQALHCSMIAFTHPHTGENTIISAPLPEDMRQLIALLNLNLDTAARVY
jgi:23S rRNA pseudouridine1911/1915/1917 synthase